MLPDGAAVGGGRRKWAGTSPPHRHRTGRCGRHTTAPPDGVCTSSVLALGQWLCVSHRRMRVSPQPCVWVACAGSWYGGCAANLAIRNSRLAAMPAVPPRESASTHVHTSWHAACLVQPAQPPPRAARYLQRRSAAGEWATIVSWYLVAHACRGRHMQRRQRVHHCYVSVPHACRAKRSDVGLGEGSPSPPPSSVPSVRGMREPRMVTWSRHARAMRAPRASLARASRGPFTSHARAAHTPRAGLSRAARVPCMSHVLWHALVCARCRRCLRMLDPHRD